MYAHAQRLSQTEITHGQHRVAKTKLEEHQVKTICASKPQIAHYGDIYQSKVKTLLKILYYGKENPMLGI